ncbi:MAG: aminotransferase class V-fold PLP-dependent enzyme [Deltaproteobacteria bacterium]|nr:aminotransferase class V-fold PLP-dependent enzyme [Deltaproteobacteria bacterium]
MEYARWRAEFPSCEQLINFNHAGVSSVSLRVARAVTGFIEQATAVDGRVHQAWEQRAQAVRAAFARLIGAQASDIAFITNTSEGLSLVAGGLSWRAGDNIIAIDGDYPSNVYPWWGLRRFGVDTRMVTPRNGRFGVDEVRAASDARTRLLAVSAVDWQTGFRCDLRALGAFCRERGFLFCVDAIQAVGALPIDVTQALIDCLAAGGHKWLLAPEGCGCLYVSPRVIEQVQPTLLGWKSVTDADHYLPYRFELRSDAGRLEPGTPPYLGIHALGAALDLLHDAGAAAIETRVLELSALLAEGLRARGAQILSPWREQERSGILTFRLGDDPSQLVSSLRRQGILCRPRGGGVRLAPHFYNNEDDIARFFSALDHAGQWP